MDPQQHWQAQLQSGRRLDVVQWTSVGDELVGYVVDGARVVRADSLTGFAGYVRRARVVTALPGNGWTVSYRMDDGCVEKREVVAWLVYDDGTVVGHDADEDGLVYPSCEAVNFSHLAKV
ncbi:hypothetical protein GCM10010174_39610 [Kutzneria viridogrisea]|uniref:Uncharacterized protein n=1 Tax=Kutzneria viridogrisea TaxID=47990 RepID=A0ABR6BMP5_9PSEU|nr:hypothetical protein [Kutzneria viridogrisea]